MQTRLRLKVFSLGGICNKLGRSATLEIDTILYVSSLKKCWVGENFDSTID